MIPERERRGTRNMVIGARLFSFTGYGMAKELTNPAFDYSQVSEDEAGKLNYFEGQLIASRRKVAEEAIKHGEVLHGVQQLLANYKGGTFLSWLASVGISKQSGYNAINAFVEFGSCPNVDNLEVSALYTLAKNDEAKKRAIKLADKGVKVTNAMAKALVADQQPDAPDEDEPPETDEPSEPELWQKYEKVHKEAVRDLNRIIRELKAITEEPSGEYVAISFTRIQKNLADAKTSIYQLMPMGWKSKKVVTRMDQQRRKK